MLKLVFSKTSLFFETVGTIHEGNDLQPLGPAYYQSLCHLSFGFLSAMAQVYNLFCLYGGDKLMSGCLWSWRKAAI